MKNDQLAEFIVGSWELEAWTIDYSDGRVTWPFGQHAIGQILYANDGYMSATIMAADRAKLSNSNVRSASKQEQVDAFLSYFHYAGAWSIDGNDVLHHVTLALNPNSVGSLQRRTATSDNINELVLSAPELIESGLSRNHKIQWRRARLIL